MRVADIKVGQTYEVRGRFGPQLVMAVEKRDRVVYSNRGVRHRTPGWSVDITNAHAPAASATVDVTPQMVVQPWAARVEADAAKERVEASAAARDRDVLARLNEVGLPAHRYMTRDGRELPGLYSITIDRDFALRLLERWEQT